MKKKLEGYFEFRLKPVEYTNETEGNVEVIISDQGFVENLKMIFYQFDEVVKEVNLWYAGKIETNKSLFKADINFYKSGIYWYYFSFELEGEQRYVFKGNNKERYCL